MKSSPQSADCASFDDRAGYPAIDEALSHSLQSYGDALHERQPSAAAGGALTDLQAPFECARRFVQRAERARHRFDVQQPGRAVPPLAAFITTTPSHWLGGVLVQATPAQWSVDLCAGHPGGSSVVESQGVTVETTLQKRSVE
jgi:hypothetical protein